MLIINQNMDKVENVSDTHFRQIDQWRRNICQVFKRREYPEIHDVIIRTLLVCEFVLAIN